MRATGLDILFQDLATSARGLRSRPGYVIVATLTLAVGIGVSTVVFSIIDAIAFAPLPYDDPGRLVALYERSLENPEIDRWPVAPANWLDWRSASDSFVGLAAYDYASPALIEGESAQRIRGIVVSADTFHLLGARAARGRVLTPADADGDPVAVISHGLWQRALGGDEDVVGRRVRLDGDAVQIVGIMPEGFRFPYDHATDVWRPLALTPELAADRAGPRLFVVGRLRPGVSPDRARQELAAIAASLADEHPQTNEGRGITLVTMRQDSLEWRLPALRIFAVAVAAALAIACLNLAGLMLSRGLSRADEIAVRRALGAGRGRIAWLLTSEGLLLALPAATLGVLLAAALLPWLVEIAPGGWGGPMLEAAGIDRRALAFAALLAGATALLASLASASRMSGEPASSLLPSSNRTTGGRSQVRMRRSLVLIQVVLAVLLLGEAGLLARSMLNVLAYDVGVDHEGVLAARISVDPERVEPAPFFRRLQDRAAAIPGVEAVAVANIAPLSGGGMPVDVTTDGSPPVAGLDTRAYDRDVQYRIVGPGFFRMLGIGVTRGRTFAETDTSAGERVAVVNEEFVRRILGGDDPLGSTVRAAPIFHRVSPGFDDPMRVVGVVDDVAEWGIWSRPPIVYVPHDQVPTATRMTVLLRTPGAPDAVAESLRDAVWELGNPLPVENVGTLAEYQDDLYRMHDFMLALIALFAVVALVLAATGLYGVMSLQLRLRRRELSIRRALGARGRSLLATLLREGAALTAVGTVVAALLAAASGRWVAESWLGNFLFEVGWFDPLSFGVAALLLAVVALIACLVPARRAATVDPAGALKAEP